MNITEKNELTMIFEQLFIMYFQVNYMIYL